MVSVVLCAGQGSQKVGMGKDLADAFPAARDTFAAIDDVLGVKLSKLMWEGPEEELTLTHNAQPAILAHTCAVLAVVAPKLDQVAAAAGHSLGEYSAWVVAGALTPTDAARIVRLRGEAMLEAGKVRPGAMAAVLGISAAEVAAACTRSSDAKSVVVPANLNAPDQTVISGDVTAVNRASEACKAPIDEKSRSELRHCNIRIGSNTWLSSARTNSGSNGSQRPVVPKVPSRVARPARPAICASSAGVSLRNW